jgi:hypothetical protein
MSGPYKDPKKEMMANGRRIADLMRPAPDGIEGVIVAHATPGGIPENFNPHDRRNLQVTIEPDSVNRHQLNLASLTDHAVNQAMQTARERVSGNDIKSIRERAAVAFEELAKLSNSGVRRAESPVKAAAQAADIARAVEPVDAPEPVYAATTSAPPLDAIDRGYSPMAAFGLKKSPRSSTPVVSTSLADKAGPPQKLVYFEKEGIGTVPAFFHDIIISTTRDNPEVPEESGFLVLIYDLRFEQSAARWFPPANDPYQRPWAVKINDDRRLYLVHTTGFQYVYDNIEFCVLLVEKALRPAIVEE